MQVNSPAASWNPPNLLVVQQLDPSEQFGRRHGWLDEKGRGSEGTRLLKLLTQASATQISKGKARSYSPTAFKEIAVASSPLNDQASSDLLLKQEIQCLPLGLYRKSW
ncbi:hypothetical protein JRQ81_013596 [Phrynocephalus forsythii]|uniref:Uncharacterized protein n=1 Tax=Phrynocephalus forsythii TaxID=171643 RepID=A0A9Q1B4W6_9SAUR|nr:hypothetical protein JRQ81_013596 [Phrynocephalus forsythii]